MNSYETLLLSHPKNHVLQITLNRPAAANAFNTQMAQDLVNAFEAITMDPGDTRVLVLTGSGDRAFCAGGPEGTQRYERYGLGQAAFNL